MATFEISSPDGATYQVTAPDGASQDEVMQYAQAQHAATPAAAPGLSPQQADAALPTTLPIFGMDTGIPVPKSFMAGIVGAGKTAEGWINGARQMLPGDNTALAFQVADENQRMGALTQAHPVATTIGQIAPYFATSNPLALAAMSGAQYGTPLQRAENAGLAFGGAKVAQGVARMFGPQSMAPVATDAANQWGIPLRMAQTTDSKPVQIIDSVLQNLPVTSGVIDKAKTASYQGFNRAVGNTFGVDTTQLTPEVLGRAKSAIGGTIGDIAGRSSMTVDNNLVASLDAIKARAVKDLVPDQAKLVSNQIDDLWTHVDPDTMTVPGEFYKNFDSNLGQLAKSNTGTVSNVLGDLRGTLRDAMDSSIGPTDAAAWKQARSQYFNLQQVAQAAKQTPGDLSPSRLLTAVNSAQRNARFGAGNDLANLAQWAKNTMPDAIPNSGTPQRLFYQQMLTHPLTTIGSGAGVLYGMHEFGLNPFDALAGGLLAYGAARGVAGAPVAPLTRALMTSGGGGIGGLLGQNLAQ